MGAWTTGGVGAACLVLFTLFHWLSIFAKGRAVLAFLGVLLIGSTGVVSGLMHSAAAWTASLLDNATAWAFGFAVPGLLALVLGAVLIHDLHPKHTAGKRTGWIAIALAAVIATGVSGITALDHLPSATRHGVNNARTAITSVR